MFGGMKVSVSLILSFGLAPVKRLARKMHEPSPQKLFGKGFEISSDFGTWEQKRSSKTETGTPNGKYT